MTASAKSPFALVLPGAVSRGAYEAGVIDILVGQDLNIERIVATSSGALNGLAFAAGIRAGRKREMVDLLIQSWIDRGSWKGTLTFSPRAFLKGRGLSSHAGLISMMRALVKPCRSELRHNVELCVILTPLNGVISKIGERTATTYETVLKFSNEDFDSQESLEKIFKVVAAACSFPGLFEPVDVEGLGCCVDGGAVNNAPIRYAIQQSGVNRVIVPVPYPSVMKPGDWKSGLSLLNHLIEILINERLYRDLKETHSVNREVENLERLANENFITNEQLVAIKRAVNARKVEITQIRPTQRLNQSPFAGFFSRRERIRLVEEGREAAIEILKKIPLHNPSGAQTTL